MEPTHANVDVSLAVTEFICAIMEAFLTIMDLLTLPRAYYLPDPVPTCDIQTVWKRGE
jgi:hypothetical protein